MRARCKVVLAFEPHRAHFYTGIPSNWLKTLEVITTEGLPKTILYVDLCNEWPGDVWVPFMMPPLNFGEWDHPISMGTLQQRQISDNSLRRSIRFPWILTHHDMENGCSA